MAFVVTVAFLNGALNIINKMVNVRAKQVLGMANGTLINYLEGTVLALALALLAGDRHLAQPGYLGSIPFLYYLGGVFGLVAMVLTIRGMEKVPVAVSAVVILGGQLFDGRRRRTGGPPGAGGALPGGGGGLVEQPPKPAGRPGGGGGNGPLRPVKEGSFSDGESGCGTPFPQQGYPLAFLALREKRGIYPPLFTLFPLLTNHFCVWKKHFSALRACSASQGAKQVLTLHLRP